MDPSLRLSDFDYPLPDGSIADEPARPRDTSRLMVVDRQSRSWADSRFLDLGRHLDPSDVLVLNDTRVLKARVYGTLERTGRQVEVFFVNAIDARCWQAMLHPGRRVRKGDSIRLGPEAHCLVGESDESGLRTLTLTGPNAPSVSEVMEGWGHVPLPPYIRRPDRPQDGVDYQTVYARSDGSVAAPTAGLHFSERVLKDLGERGIQTASLTHHVGMGTFVPVRTPDPREHRLHAERYEISEAAAEALNRARSKGHRLIAVGTTTTRTLEHVVSTHGHFKAGRGNTSLCILPGHRFQAIQGLVTNFHLPRTSLLMLVCAFASTEFVLEAYRYAIDSGYRFYSYGDAMLLL